MDVPPPQPAPSPEHPAVINYYASLNELKRQTSITKQKISMGESVDTRLQLQAMSLFLTNAEHYTYYIKYTRYLPQDPQ